MVNFFECGDGNFESVGKRGYLGSHYFGVFPLKFFAIYIHTLIMSVC